MVDVRFREFATDDCNGKFFTKLSIDSAAPQPISISPFKEGKYEYKYDMRDGTQTNILYDDLLPPQKRKDIFSIDDYDNYDNYDEPQIIVDTMIVPGMITSQEPS